MIYFLIFSVFINLILLFLITKNRTQENNNRKKISDEYVRGLNYLISQENDKALDMFISAVNYDDDNIETLVNKCVSMAKLAPIDDTAVLGDSSLFESEIGNLELHQSEETNTEALIDSVKECEEAALSVPGISNSEGAGASYSQGEFYLATSNGFEGGYKSSTNSISSLLIDTSSDLLNPPEKPIKISVLSLNFLISFSEESLITLMICFKLLNNNGFFAF